MDDFPNYLKVDIKISMSYSIPQTYDLSPFYFWMALTEI